MNEFLVLGRYLNNYRNDKFLFCLVENWETPSFSPNILLPNQDITKNDLVYIEDYFSNFQWNNKAVKKTPYFNFINNYSGYDLKKIKSVCEENNWNIEKEPLRINFLKNPIKIKLHDEYEYSITKTLNGILPECYKEIIRHNFNLDNDYIKYIEKIFRRDYVDTYIVLVKNRSGECIAGGAVSMCNNIGFMTWGSVNKEYRNKGIHQILLAVIKNLCDEMGIHSCAYTTRNKYIVNKCDYNIEMLICRKKIV
jgi:hypothetical protein